MDEQDDPMQENIAYCLPSKAVDSKLFENRASAQRQYSSDCRLHLHQGFPRIVGRLPALLKPEIVDSAGFVNNRPQSGPGVFETLSRK
jgi:hypothetical protein